MASAGGAPDHPFWYRNLLAHPEVRVQVGTKVTQAVARTVDAAEKARFWPLMTAIWPAYDDYARKTDRDIPVVAITPN